MTKISILHPSRSRPEQAAISGEWMASIRGTENWEYILSLDSTDIKLDSYFKFGSTKKYLNAQAIINDNSNIVDAVNNAAKVSSGDIIIVISDDFLCFPGWNVAITEALKGKSGVLKTYDGIQKWIVTLPIMTRDYYESQGYIYHPSYFHMFSDSDQTHKADLQKKLIIRNDIVFKHNHYSIGGQPKDEVNKKADSTWAQGEKVYLQRCKEKFGLGNVNIYDLSPEATKAGHVAWLKKKLR